MTGRLFICLKWQVCVGDEDFSKGYRRKGKSPIQPNKKTPKKGSFRSKIANQLSKEITHGQVQLAYS